MGRQMVELQLNGMGTKFKNMGFQIECKPANKQKYCIYIFKLYYN